MATLTVPIRQVNGMSEEVKTRTLPTTYPVFRSLSTASDGTIWALVRDPIEKRDRVPGLYLVQIPPVVAGEASKASRVLLEKGTADDPWNDLALRSDGKPIAVWFSEDAKGLKLYAP